MRRVVIALALVALVGSAAAPGPPDRNPRDPREAFTAADQAWAKRIVLKRSDLPAGWRASPPQGEDPRCATFDPDMSDLTVTGEAETGFGRGAALVASLVQVFATTRDAAASWQRGAKPNVIRCYDDGLRAAFGNQAQVKLVTGRVVAAPRVGERRFAIRLVWSVTLSGVTVRAQADVFAFDRGRASASVALVTVGDAPDPALARRIAERLDTRMRP